VADCLTAYPWPGNVRELSNAMERAALLSLGDLILPEHLPARLRNSAATQTPGASVSVSADPKDLGDIEREAILGALRQHHFNRTETAKALGLSRRALLYKLQRFREQGFEVDPPQSGA